MHIKKNLKCAALLGAAITGLSLTAAEYPAEGTLELEFPLPEAQKTELWVAYTNKVIQAQLDHLAKKYADAKFDVSMDPAEYKELLMQGRNEENLLPEEKRAIDSEYRTYYDEWLRINDPDKWDFSLFPGGKDTIISEQAKKGKNGKGIITSRARARRK